MGFFVRAVDVVAAKANKMLDSIEDSGEVIDQKIIRAKKEYADNKAQSSEVFAAEKSAENDVKAANKKIEEFNAVARAAVNAGNDADAEAALTKVAEYEEELERAQSHYNIMHKKANQLRDQLKDSLETIKELEKQADIVKANSAYTKAVSSKTTGNISSSALDDAKRIVAKSERDVVKAEAMNDFEDYMNAGDESEDLLKKYSGAAKSPVSDRLAALKQEMGK